jgi:transposase
MAWTEITRRQYRREDQRYASDLTDAEWALIEPSMPPPSRIGRPRETDLRTVVNAILFSIRPAEVKALLALSRCNVRSSLQALASLRNRHEALP